MGALPWLVGGAAVGLGVLYVRSARAARSSPGGSFCASVLQPAARTVGYDVPPAACGVVDKLAERVANAFKSWEDKDRENRRLNGEPETLLVDAVAAAAVAVDPNAVGGGTAPMLRGSVLRFRNGCVPFAGHPDKAKCAPGTFSMLTASSGRGYKKADPSAPLTFTRLREADAAYDRGDLDAARAIVYAAADTGALLSGQPTDPATVLHRKASDGRYYLAGAPFACDDGSRPIGATDHRDGASSTATAICAPPGTFTGADPARDDGTATRPTDATRVPTTAEPGDPPPGYVWTGTHWERAR